MLLVAKITHITFGFMFICAVFYALGALVSNEPISYIVISIVILALLIVAIIALKKYIVKKSTSTELKNYGLTIRQVFLAVFGLMQVLSIYKGNKFLHAVIFALILAIIVAIQRRKLKNRAETDNFI